MTWRLTPTEPLVAEWGCVLHRPACTLVNRERRPRVLLSWVEDGDGWVTDDPYVEVCGRCCPEGQEGVIEIVVEDLMGRLA